MGLRSRENLRYDAISGLPSTRCETASVRWPDGRPAGRALGDPDECGDVDQWLAGTVDEAQQLLRLAPVEVLDAGPI